MSNYALVGHEQILLGQCRMTNCYLQPCILQSNAIVTIIYWSYLFLPRLFIYLSARLSFCSCQTWRCFTSHLQIIKAPVSRYGNDILFFIMLHHLPVVSHSHTHNSVLCYILDVFLDQKYHNAPTFIILCILPIIMIVHHLTI